jgi:hypothetical protein
MSTPTTVKEAVKSSLLGSEEPVNLSASYRATFLSNAKKDESTGEPVMGLEEFVDAIAPADEDYVSFLVLCQHQTTQVSSLANKASSLFFCSLRYIATSMASFSALLTVQGLVKSPWAIGLPS